ncbi:putative galactose-proton symport [Xylariales sp. AK1849]|nr:putative galactose-proton symport [Xylariales sp. AK1849]
MSEFTPTWKQPSHPVSIKVVKGARPYTSSARSLVALPRGALFSKINTPTAAPRKTYTSVQVGPGVNVELCSDLVYCNHSCSPSLEFDMSSFEVRVAQDRPLSVGDELTFFYPSTEWDMVQPFKCTCGSRKCLGLIAGSKDLDAIILSRYWLNPHVERLLMERA